MKSHFSKTKFSFPFSTVSNFQTFSPTNKNNLSGQISDINGAAVVLKRQTRGLEEAATPGKETYMNPQIRLE